MKQKYFILSTLLAIAASQRIPWVGTMPTNQPASGTLPTNSTIYLPIWVSKWSATSNGFSLTYITSTQNVWIVLEGTDSSTNCWSEMKRWYQTTSTNIPTDCTFPNQTSKDKSFYRLRILP